MGVGMAMKEQDLLELYQLLTAYRTTYGEEAGAVGGVSGLLGMVGQRYRERTCGKDIREGSNPRGAGRKKSYPKEHDEGIMGLYRKGLSVRQTAKEMCCSPGHVQDVIRRQKQQIRAGQSRVYGN